MIEEHRAGCKVACLGFWYLILSLNMPLSIKTDCYCVTLFGSGNVDKGWQVAAYRVFHFSLTIFVVAFFWVFDGLSSVGCFVFCLIFCRVK